MPRLLALVLGRLCRSLSLPHHRHDRHRTFKARVPARAGRLLRFPSASAAESRLRPAASRQSVALGAAHDD